VFTSRPRKRFSCARTTASWASSKACQSRSPMSAARRVESGRPPSECRHDGTGDSRPRASGFDCDRRRPGYAMVVRGDGLQAALRMGACGHRGWTMVHPCGLVVTALTHAEGDFSAFDERRVGLDHVAFRVSDLDAPREWASRPDALHVSHSGVQDVQGNRGGPLIVLRDPDNIQIELTAGWHLSK
jgi:catechol 2,3-dioxygenase-like lactoylglutathione lyase family enzyme